MKMNLAKATIAVLAATLLTTTAAISDEIGVKNIVLVHGAWADGSGWRAIYDILKKDGYNVRMVQNPLTSLADDVAATDRVVNRMDGPTILVGHSYGGAVITQAGDNKKVVGLVYVEAFMPDKGESVFGLLPQDPKNPPPFDLTKDGFVFFNEAAYVPGFADSLPAADAEFFRDSQVPISLKGAGGTKLKVAAWRTKPSWYQTADADHVIPPAQQEMMFTRAHSTVQKVTGGHLSFIAHADETAKLIETAAKASAKP
ncbi:alpha/beta hydrolase [Mesorhizobium sp. B2-3-5]|nr:alpha/beta hydrolase [Mesorhizobium sp. B2-3-5]